jgi:hypothetical protein
MNYIICVTLAALMASTLKISTYNSQGMGDGRIEIISKLCKENDIVLLQEHWLMNSQLYLLEKRIDNVLVHGCSPINESEYQTGRPYGGCAILWKDTFSCSVIPVNTKSTRLCAISINVEIY